MVSTDQARASSVAHTTIALSGIRLLIHVVVFVVVVVMHITYATVLIIFMDASHGHRYKNFFRRFYIHSILSLVGRNTQETIDQIDSLRLL